MANEKDVLKAEAHPQWGNTEPIQTSFLFIVSHAWASAYAKMRNSNKKSAQPPTSLLDVLAGLRVWQVSSKMSGVKLWANWSRYWQAEAKPSYIWKIRLPPRYVSFWAFQFQLCWYSCSESEVIDRVHMFTCLPQQWISTILAGDPLKWSKLTRECLSKVTVFWSKEWFLPFEVVFSHANGSGSTVADWNYWMNGLESLYRHLWSPPESHWLFISSHQ